MRLLLLALVSFLAVACETPATEPISDDLPKGVWRGVLKIDEQKDLYLPFNFEVVANDKIIIRNGEERIEVSDITIDSQFVSIKMPVFGSEFKLNRNKDTLVGEWINYNKEDYSIPFIANANDDMRFPKAKNMLSSGLKRKWKVAFSPYTEDEYPAIGLFEMQDNGRVTGTFLTETGDYRYLEGHFDGENLHLSCFDGAHAFLFTAKMLEEERLSGHFWSGKHWHEEWIAVPADSTFELAKMDTLTYLKEGYDKLAFSLPDENGDTISLDDELFQGKPTIVQITGTWCPNCMDETRFLVEVYNQYKDRGLRVVAIDYEAIDDFEVFQKNVKRIRDHLGVNYPVVYGGHANKAVAATTLPMLNHIMSYPTAIFIDKNGEVKEIHTGFSGPGTGDLYQQYVDKTINLVEEMVRKS